MFITPYTSIHASAGPSWQQLLEDYKIECIRSCIEHTRQYLNFNNQAHSLIQSTLTSNEDSDHEEPESLKNMLKALQITINLAVSIEKHRNAIENIQNIQRKEAELHKLQGSSANSQTSTTTGSRPRSHSR